jgi:ribosomal protein L29
VKPAEIRVLSEDELEQRLSELHTEWRELRFQEAVGS